MKKIFVALLMLCLVFVMCACGTDVKASATETPNPTVAVVTSTPAPTVTPTPTPTPTPTLKTVITKQPTSETKSIGGNTLFISKADNYDTVTWYCVEQNGTVIKADQVSAVYAGAWTSNTDTESMSIGNITASLDGCGFYASFSYNGTETTSDIAYLYISKDIVITHNPTDEYRDLQTNWYWDSERNCARNDSVYLQYVIEGTNIESVQWYIHTDHDSPAGNYAGVLGATSTTLSIPARSDLSGCTVYAVVSNSYGYTATTTPASYTVVYTKYYPSPTAYNYVFTMASNSANYTINGIAAPQISSTSNTFTFVPSINGTLTIYQGNMSSGVEYSNAVSAGQSYTITVNPNIYSFLFNLQ